MCAAPRPGRLEHRASSPACRTDVGNVGAAQIEKMVFLPSSPPLRALIPLSSTSALLILFPYNWGTFIHSEVMGAIRLTSGGLCRESIRHHRSELKKGKISGVSEGHNGGVGDSLTQAVSSVGGKTSSPCRLKPILDFSLSS